MDAVELNDMKGRPLTTSERIALEKEDNFLDALSLLNDYLIEEVLDRLYFTDDVEAYCKKKRKILVNKIVAFFKNSWSYRETGDKIDLSSILEYDFGFQGTINELFVYVKKRTTPFRVLLKYHANIETLRNELYLSE